MPRRRLGTARGGGPSTRSLQPQPAPSSTAPWLPVSRSATHSAGDSAYYPRMLEDRPGRGGGGGPRGPMREEKPRWRLPWSQVASNEEITEQWRYACSLLLGHCHPTGTMKGELDQPIRPHVSLDLPRKKTLGAQM